MSSGKRKREDFASKYHTGGYIPQQDGAGDATSEILQVEVCLSSYVWIFLMWCCINVLHKNIVLTKAMKLLI